MKTAQLVFILVAYQVIAGMLFVGTGVVDTTDLFPTLDVPEFSDNEFPSSCSGFTDCVEFVGDILKVAFETVYETLQLTANLVIYIFAVGAYVLKTAVMGIPGAPPEINLFIQVPMIIGMAIIVYRLARSGASED